MNVYAYRTPDMPGLVARNINTRLNNILREVKDIKESGCMDLHMLTKECWAAGWQHGHHGMMEDDQAEINYGGTK